MTIYTTTPEERIKELQRENSELRAELQRLLQAQYVPVEDGEYGTGDTIKISENGEMLEINSAYGDGSRKRQAMIPLPHGLRLAAPQQEGDE